MHFSQLVDRFWQNLRRAAGFKVQYFSTVEEQKRLAPHLHAAVRGIVPRSVVHQVIAGTYHQVWWPAFDEPIYTSRAPEWDDLRQTYVDPWSGVPLSTWQQAMDRLDADLDADPSLEPAHVIRFGEQADYKWFIPGSERTGRIIGYLTKYLTKAIAETHDPEATSRRQRAHADRLMDEVRWLPCSPECPNWLRFGIQPRDVRAEMVPGSCSRAAHNPDNLGFGGRRVLVSRLWTGKTLNRHRADKREAIRQFITGAGLEAEMVENERFTASADGGRYRWEPLSLQEISSGMRRTAILNAINDAHAWRERWEEAKARAGPPARGLLIASPPLVSALPVKGERSESRVTKALDGQSGDHPIDRREAAGPNHTERRGSWRSS